MRFWWWRLSSILQVFVILAKVAQGPGNDAVVIINNLNTTNNVQPNVDQAESGIVKLKIKDNSLGIEEGTTLPPGVNATSTRTAVITGRQDILNETGNGNEHYTKLLSNTTPRPLVELGLAGIRRTTANSSGNSTTVKPHPQRNKNKVILYVLIPAGCVLFLCIVFCVIRHAQRVQRKRRLERELLHQYSYPNSETDDMEYDQRILEVESVINTQFSVTDHDYDKDYTDDIPQVAVTIGDGPKLVMQESPPSPDDMEASTSFNC